jgi:hypothetical protein
MDLYPVIVSLFVLVAILFVLNIGAYIYIGQVVNRYIFEKETEQSNPIYYPPTGTVVFQPTPPTGTVVFQPTPSTGTQPVVVQPVPIPQQPSQPPTGNYTTFELPGPTNFSAYNSEYAVLDYKVTVVLVNPIIQNVVFTTLSGSKFNISDTFESEGETKVIGKASLDYNAAMNKQVLNISITNDELNPVLQGVVNDTNKIFTATTFVEITSS